MTKNYDHGFGTGEGDQLYATEGQARSALARLLSTLGNLSLPGTRRDGGRIVQYKGTSRDGQPLVVDIRHDLDDPHAETTGSFDVRVKKGGSGATTHLAHKRR